jgi:hypothetical protein
MLSPSGGVRGRILYTQKIYISIMKKIILLIILIPFLTNKLYSQENKSFKYLDTLGKSITKEEFSLLTSEHKYLAIKINENTNQLFKRENHGTIPDYKKLASLLDLKKDNKKPFVVIYSLEKMDVIQQVRKTI